MKITRLVILFNYKKILLGAVISLFLFILSFQIGSAILISLMRGLGALIIINIIASLAASYILYDKSGLYELNDLDGIIDWSKTEMQFSSTPVLIRCPKGWRRNTLI
ncbi:hypothetical protein EJ377_16875 [Chryseobacterium arthrosphaerae]|uniref:Uncharacterized protein n=1 Tax=Chryseobacterium arthrosphaerae TaxID=651561 RepID=A0A3S0Q4D1_9FLAO|nr:hypothetical protein EJ377_16875 [Chryseobacterium arthrosphaerae]